MALHLDMHHRGKILNASLQIFANICYQSILMSCLNQCIMHDNYILKKTIKSEKCMELIQLKTSWIFIICGRFTHPLLIVDSRFSLLLHWKCVQLKRIGRFGNILWSFSKGSVQKKKQWILWIWHYFPLDPPSHHK